ncbi:hypothetical protein AAZX31_19G044800 [Glycine max]|uniref:Uncharacterized protein n=1 Tax=Glycine soja TaxID=3848 RepID=A0A445FCF5_GLYSO|nr:uncharacterized protein LOC114399804 isoform X1 [Glycine soja]KAG5085155.1 hypothetical protein JHK82_052552 [Glycine max]KAH1076454.1 hypothetical protein GYH30_052098 [Glycine max]RZB46525.1 hypothetical protein D0Y65_050523 [Glycine soja]
MDDLQNITANGETICKEMKVNKKETMEKEEEEDRRREAAMASSSCLRPNFNPKGITQDQLSKFRELHKRRLQLKSKSKFKTKSKDGANKKSHGYGLSSQNSVTQGSNVDHRESRLWNDCEGFDSRIEDSKDDVPVMSEPKKQKLHWGLDTKNRWERKSNM